MKPKFRDLLRTPGLRALGAVWFVLPALPLAGYQAAGGQGLLAGAAASVGFALAIPVLWGIYVVSWLRYRATWRRRGALCPHCDQTYEGRRACGRCGGELPPASYVLRGWMIPGCPLGDCGGEISETGAHVRCLRAGCREDAATFGAESVRGTIVLVLVKALRTLPRLGSPIPLRADSPAMSKQTRCGPETAVLTYQIVDRDFETSLLEKHTQQRIAHVLVEEGVNPLAVENLSNLWPRWLGGRHVEHGMDGVTIEEYVESLCGP